MVVSAAPGDAVTRAAMELQPAFRAIGPSGLFARYIHADLEDTFEFLEALEARGSPRPEDDVIVFHASIGEPPVFAFLHERPERLVVNYHNVSPADAFREYDPAFAGLLEGGREEVARLAERAVLGLADSSFNAAELIDMGYPHVQVAPPVVDFDRLLSQHSPPELERRLAAVTDGPVALFVGQLLPHKRPDFLLEMFHFLSTYLEPMAALVMIGAPRLPAYAGVIETAVSELNLQPVLLPGAVDDRELAAWFRRADVFVTASEHEGFCMPLLEAMAFGVPVVAREYAAVPETVGGAGLVLPADASPAVAAEAVARIVGDEPVRQGLMAAGRARVKGFDPARTRVAILRHVLAAVGGGAAA